MEIKLTIPERLFLVPILPKEGNFLTLRVVKELQMKVGISAQDISDYEITEKDGLVKWNESGNVPITINFLDSEMDIIKKELKRLDSDGKLNMNLFSIYEKIML